MPIARHSALAWLVGAVGCNLVLGIDERSPKPDPVVSIGSGGSGGAVVEDALYVSPRGDDANDGRSSAEPMQSIAAALDVARANSAIEKIYVCAGSYSELELKLDVPVSLLGGFDCDSWMQTQDYGWPLFDNVNETLVEPSDGRNMLLFVTGEAVDRDVLIDGFTWKAGANDEDGAVAVMVDRDSKPTISNNRVVGGTGTKGSLGMYVFGNPDIVHNDIDGGSASVDVANPAAASIGVAVAFGSQPYIHENRIDGGSGTWAVDGYGGAGSIALLSNGGIMSEATGNPVTKNAIHAGTGSTPTGFPAMAVAVSGGFVTFVENTVVGTPGDCPVPQSWGCFGIMLDSVAGAGVFNNRIFGGGGSGYFAALQAVDVVDLAIKNNFVFGANHDPSESETTHGTGIVLIDATDPLVAHNTITSGNTVAPGGGIGIVLQGATTAARIANNILLEPLGGTDLALNTCPSQAINFFRNNAMLYEATMVYGTTVDAPCTPSVHTNVADIESELEQYGTAQDNLVLRADCAGQSSCVTVPGCTDAQACAAALFDDWTAGGYTELMSTGWLLPTTVPCAVAKSTFVEASVLTDFFGETRKPPPSMGAHEQDSCL